MVFNFHCPFSTTACLQLSFIFHMLRACQACNVKVHNTFLLFHTSLFEGKWVFCRGHRGAAAPPKKWHYQNHQLMCQKMYVSVDLTLLPFMQINTFIFTQKKKHIIV